MQTMTSRRPRRTRYASAATLAFALAVVGCGAPPAPELTSPTEIVLAMLATTESTKSVHAEATLSGEVKIALIPGGPTAPVDLTGSTASADLDLVGGAAHATFAVPNLFDLSGDLVAIGGKAYIKTTVTGPTYRVTDLGDTIPLDVTSAKGLADTLGDFLMNDQVTLTKGEDTACGPKRCYAVTTQLAADDLAAMLGGGIQLPAGLPIDLAGAALALEVRVEKELPNRLGGLTLTITPAAGDPLTVDVTFSKWDESVTVTAPPADQLSGG